MPENLPDGFEFGPPQQRVKSDSSLFPNATMTAWFNNERAFTDTEYDAIEAGTHRIYVWGVMYYKDAYRGARTTVFNVSVGGPNFKETMRQIRSGKSNPGPGYIWVKGPKDSQAT
jgi:hypothetical protein